MNQREAKRDACRVVAALISSYLGVGQPYDEHGCAVEGCKECDRKVKAFEDLQWELERRGGM